MHFISCPISLVYLFKKKKNEGKKGVKFTVVTNKRRWTKVQTLAVQALLGNVKLCGMTSQHSNENPTLQFEFIRCWWQNFLQKIEMRFKTLVCPNMFSYIHRNIRTEMKSDNKLYIRYNDVASSMWFYLPHKWIKII